MDPVLKRALRNLQRRLTALEVEVEKLQNERARHCDVLESHQDALDQLDRTVDALLVDGAPDPEVSH